MEVRFNTRELAEHGIQIITPANPSFEETSAKYFGDKRPPMLQPFAVFIKNSSSRLVVAYALTWELNDEDGQNVKTHTVSYAEPGILMGDEIPIGMKHTTAIEPGNVRCFSVDSKIERDEVESDDASSKQLRNIIAAHLARATDVIVSLDGVIFDDGSFIGPNRTAFIDQMRALVDAKTDLLRDIAEAHKRGNVDQAFSSIRAISQEPNVDFGSTFSADAYYRHFKKVYATEIANQRDAYGEKKLLPHLVKSHGRVKKLNELGSDSSK